MTVYVVQQVFKNTDRGLEPVKDLSPARAYGEIKFLYQATRASGASGLPSKQAKKFYDKMLDQLWVNGLQDFTDEDYLLPIGDPAAIAAAGALAAHANGGFVKILCWNNQTLRYHVAELDLWDDDTSERIEPKMEHIAT